MLAPDVADLRPGDAVKLRGTGHPAHTGGKAVVAAVHLSRTTPGAVEAVDVRYSARGVALRVELDGPGELVRFTAPWPATATAPAPHAPATAVAGAGPPLSRRRIALVLGGVAAGAALLVAWPHSAPPAPSPGQAPTGAIAVVAAGGETGEGTGRTATTSPSPSPSPSTPATPLPRSRVVAWSAGPVPVVAPPTGEPSPVPLAGITEVDGCHDAYAAELLRLLPTGAPVDVTGSGYLRTAAGVDVNAQLVRDGVAEPVAPQTPGTDADRAGWATVSAAGAPAPARCR